MPAGSQYRLFFPGARAYGDGGSGAQIGPNATLIFDVEMLEIAQ
jgi:FKBP-type peptidyl-prolyl cis-trans isomerase